METFSIRSTVRAQLINIDAEVTAALQQLGATSGVATIFTPHTTAAITINENADPAVCRDLLRTLEQLVPADQPHFTHGEGNSDSHLKSSLIGASEQILVEAGSPVLGTWQSLYFCEFDGPRQRRVHVVFGPEALRK